MEELKNEAHDQGGIAGPGLENGPEDRFKFLCNSKEEYTYARAVKTDSILRHKYWAMHEMEAVDLPNPRAVNS